MDSRHFCCLTGLPGLPGPRRGSGHSSPATLALAFCCSGTSSLGGSSGRSRASAPFTTHLVNDMLRACKQLVQTPAHMRARFAHWCCLFAFCECALLSRPVLPCPALSWQISSGNVSLATALALTAVAAKVYGSICICAVHLVLCSLLPTSSFRALVDGPGSQPTDIRNHTKCAVRALHAHLGVYPPHVCHRQRDWAVSIGSYMQQDMGIF